MNADNVRNIPKRIQDKGFAKSYPRTTRSNTVLSQELDADIRGCYPPATEIEFHVATPTAPNPNSVLLKEFDTADLPNPNMLLAYRMLKLLYGDPDLLACRCVLQDDTQHYSPFGMEWGYLLKIDEKLLMEVRSFLSNARLVLRLWSDHRPGDDEQEAISVKTSKFLSDYMTSINKNAHLFNEDEELPKNRLTATPMVWNVFAQNYKAAESLLELAESEDTPTLERNVLWQGVPEISTYGSLYVSSAIQFFSALEALINTVLTLKLREEFRANHYDRITVRADLDVRLMTAHLFCSGFEKQIVTPKTHLWTQLLKLRDFRNTIVHGNITPEHYIYVLNEDDNIFYYAPSLDFRGRKRERADQARYPTTMNGVREGAVTEIKETVDQVIEAILNAADAETAEWLNGWLWSPVIQPGVTEMIDRFTTNRSDSFSE